MGFEGLFDEYPIESVIASASLPDSILLPEGILLIALYIVILIYLFFFHE
ncbi:MAG: hypothetical protein K0R55_450 [Sporomusa sp.]|nr:hypothetical protein [Sporomusa sp.]